MQWWAVTYLDNIRSLHHLGVLAATNHPAHLYMAWAKYAPARRPRYITVRGKSVRCGWTYIWDTPNIVEQLEPLDTFEHTFGPLTLASTDHVWYYLFSTRTLAQRACQSFLYHVYPPEAHTWTSKMYVGTKLKGVFYTDNFTGPGGDHPTWTMANFGLHSTKIWQLEPDPLGLAYRLYTIAGDPGDRTLYVRIPAFWPTWDPLLTDAHAITLTGSTGGSLTWVSTNLYFPGYLYVLFNSTLANNGTWLLRSQDYGLTWTAHQIYPGLQNYSAGNLSVSLTQGSSIYPPGEVLYATTCSYILAKVCLWRSTDHGTTWTLIVRQAGPNIQTRGLVDATEPLIAYFGLRINAANPHELYRYTPDPPAIAEVDGTDHLGLMLEPAYPELWINPTDHTFLTALADSHIFTTIDYGLNWHDWLLTDQPVQHLALLWENPDRFYLARHLSGDPGPPSELCHVIFASEDHGATMYGKAGAYACTATGHGDSIPYNCGGLCHQGMQLFPPY